MEKRIVLGEEYEFTTFQWGKLDGSISRQKIKVVPVKAYIKEYGNEYHVLIMYKQENGKIGKCGEDYFKRNSNKIGDL